jgi:hypothetical protein
MVAKQDSIHARPDELANTGGISLLRSARDSIPFKATGADGNARAKHVQNLHWQVETTGGLVQAHTKIGHRQQARVIRCLLLQIKLPRRRRTPTWSHTVCMEESAAVAFVIFAAHRTTASRPATHL